AVARALAAYVRRGRPRRTLARTVFVSMPLPHRPLTTSVIRHRMREYARRAGVVPSVLGGHAFRHSHATRQIDSGAPPKIVCDILCARPPPRPGALGAVIGGPALRHSHAPPKIDSGAPPKIVGDILGHRRPASTSVY